MELIASILIAVSLIIIGFCGILLMRRLRRGSFELPVNQVDKPKQKQAREVAKDISPDVICLPDETALSQPTKPQQMHDTPKVERGSPEDVICLQDDATKSTLQHLRKKLHEKKRKNKQTTVKPKVV